MVDSVADLYRSGRNCRFVWDLVSLTVTPLQKQYLGTYLTCAMENGTAWHVSLAYVLKTVPKRKPELAYDADVVPRMDPFCPCNCRQQAEQKGGRELPSTPLTYIPGPPSSRFSRSSSSTGRA